MTRNGRVLRSMFLLSYNLLHVYSQHVELFPLTKTPSQLLIKPVQIPVFENEDFSWANGQVMSATSIPGGGIILLRGSAHNLFNLLSAPDFSIFFLGTFIKWRHFVSVLLRLLIEMNSFRFCCCEYLMIGQTDHDFWVIDFWVKSSQT